MGSRRYLGYVQVISTNSSSLMKNWAGVYDPMVKCRFSVKPWMNVVCLTSASLGKNSHGLSIIQMERLFGKDWIGRCAQRSGFLFFQQQRSGLSRVSSNHSPIFILPDGIVAKKQKPWRFEQFWLENEGCHDTVTAAWREVSWGPPMIEVTKKIENFQNHQRRWSKDSVCNISKTLLEKKKSLELAEAAAVRGGSMDFFLQLKSEVNDLLRTEEKLWQQRAHDHWMVSGDKNTGYFHNRASQKFRRNTIIKLRD